MTLYVIALVGIWLGIGVYSLGAAVQWVATRKARRERDEARADRDHWRARCHDHEWREHLRGVPGMGVRR